jgi:hypothetical protein
LDFSRVGRLLYYHEEKNMIISLLLYILSFLLGAFASFSNLIARGFSIWPDKLLEGITYFFVNLMRFDMVLNLVAFFTVFKWFLTFIIVYFSIKLLASLFNWGRGSGEIDV